MSFGLGMLGLIVMGSGALIAQIRLNGRVVNDNNAPVAGARVSLQGAGDRVRTAVSDPSGAFVFTLEASGEYRLHAEREGYFRLNNLIVHVPEKGGEVQVVLNPVREEFQSVDVRASTAAVDLERAATSRAVTGVNLLSVPFPSSNSLKNAMRIMPGIVQDAKGGIHLNGASEEQVLYTLNGFTLNDPLTGRFESRLGVEAVQSIEIGSGSLPADTGRGVAGSLAITTNPGDDRLRYTATNFVPGVETQKGIYIGSWTPRFNLSGPIRRGRAWFSDSASIQYDKMVLEDLPDGEDRSSSWRLANVMQTQWNLSPRQILFAGLLFNSWFARRVGLSPLTPLETSTDRRSRQWFFNIKSQRYWSRGALLEAGYAANRTFGREIPQGSEFLRITPEGQRGNAYVDAHRRGSRDQWIANAFLPSFSLAGSHQIKTGLDLGRVAYSQNLRRTGYERYRSGGILLTRTVFGGPSSLSRSNFEGAFYAQDSWRLKQRLLVELGMRLDWNRIFRHWDAAPRLGVAWWPTADSHTKLSAGFGLIHETANLRQFTRPLDQYSLTTYFDPAGRILRGPAAGIAVFGDPPPTPQARVWNVTLDRQLRTNLFLRASFQSRRLKRGVTFANVLAPDSPPDPFFLQLTGAKALDAVYRMGSNRRDVYDAAEFTLRHRFRGEYEWMAGYVRSRALSNGVVDINIDDPVVIFDNVGPMPWDTPNRLVSWGRLPLPWKNWAAAFLLECRNGYPFSITNDGSQILGALNSQRFPFFFEWNQHIERRFVLRGHRWEFRAGYNNITGRKNPNVVNSNVDSPNFMRFYGGQRRALNFRIRWLGRAAR